MQPNTQSPRRVVSTFRKTCSACPSQWDVYLTDGRYVYVRYRGGRFRAEMSSCEAAWWEDSGGTIQICQKFVGDSLDGWMETEDMKGLLADILDWSVAKEESNTFQESDDREG